MKSYFLLIIFFSLSSFASASNRETPEKVCRESWCYFRESIEGWDVYYSEELYNGNNAIFSNAKQQLGKDLRKIKTVLPSQKIKVLQNIKIHLALKDVGNRYFFGVYHWSREALIERGQDPGKYKSIEIFGADNYPHWTKSQPAAVLHELAHAYSAQYFTNDQREKVVSTFNAAIAKGLYGEVPYFDGEKTYLQKAYASKDRSEYFCESVEAYFWKNDYFPFDRDELRSYDPAMFEVLREIWND